MSLILTVPRAHAPALPDEGCWALAHWGWLAHATWRSRAQAEHDDTHLQLIPYLVLRNAEDAMWCYQRSGGDARLLGRCSCGVGGHVDAPDALTGAAGDAQSAPNDAINCAALDSCSRMPDKRSRPISRVNVEATLQRALRRELAEELGASAADLADLRCHGLIYEGHSPVGRVHLGVLYSARWCPAADPQPVAGEALCGQGFRAPARVADDPAFELWSQLAACHLATSAELTNRP